MGSMSEFSRFRITDAVLCAVFCLLCVLPASLIVVDRLVLDITEITGVGRETMNLEGRSVATFPDLSSDTVLSGSFQKGVEKWLSDNTVAREACLLTNAFMQRIPINIAADLFGFDERPTTYGGSYYRSKMYDALYWNPIAKDGKTVANVQAASEAYLAFAKRNPEKRFFLYLASGRGAPDLTGGRLFSNAVDCEFIYDKILAPLSDEYIVIDNGIDSVEQYNRRYYRTDHHWNIDGAYEAYVAIATAMGLGDNLVVPLERVVLDIDMYGATGRTSLDVSVAPEHLTDMVFDLPDCRVLKSGVEMDDPEDTLSSLNRFRSEWVTDDPFYNYYGKYFHGDGEVEMIRTEKSVGKALLVVGDSFTNCIDRLFLNNYDAVYKYDARYTEQTLQEFMDERPEISDVLVLETFYDFQDPKQSKLVGDAS